MGKLFSATLLSELGLPSVKIGIRNTRFYLDLKTDQCNNLSHQALSLDFYRVRCGWEMVVGRVRGWFSQQANPPHICMWGLFAVKLAFYLGSNTDHQHQ